MIYSEKEQEIDKELSIAEYIGSFINSKAARHARDQRLNGTKHVYKSDKPLDEFVKTKEYANNKWLDVYKNLRAANNTEEVSNSVKSKAKKPLDLAAISKITSK
jgi:hypothetical protein